MALINDVISSNLILDTLENLTEEKQTRVLEILLLYNGFDFSTHTSSKENETTFYYKDGVEYIFCVLKNIKTKKVSPCVIDLDLYNKPSENVIIEKDGQEYHITKKCFGDLSVVLVAQERNAGDFKCMCHSGGYCNAPLHRIVMSEELAKENKEDKENKRKEVDHITHSLVLNAKKYLRVCTGIENNYNKKCYSKIYKNCKQFSISIKHLDANIVKTLEMQGYTNTGNRLKSPKFNTEDEMVQELARVENLLLGKFRYNPLIDYSETWYAVVLCEVLGILTHQELEDYNRDYFKKNYPNVARYYGL